MYSPKVQGYVVNPVANWLSYRKVSLTAWRGLADRLAALAPMRKFVVSGAEAFARRRRCALAWRVDAVWPTASLRSLLWRKCWRYSVSREKWSPRGWRRRGTLSVARGETNGREWRKVCW